MHSGVLIIIVTFLAINMHMCDWQIYTMYRTYRDKQKALRRDCIHNIESRNRDFGPLLTFTI